MLYGILLTDLFLKITLLLQSTFGWITSQTLFVMIEKISHFLCGGYDFLSSFWKLSLLLIHKLVSGWVGVKLDWQRTVCHLPLDTIFVLKLSKKFPSKICLRRLAALFTWRMTFSFEAMAKLVGKNPTSSPSLIQPN
jgi:hypothetical protein